MTLSVNARYAAMGAVANPRNFRKQLKQSEVVFWGNVGVSQSLGSRYEAGTRKMPKPVRILLAAIAARSLSATDLEVLEPFMYVDIPK